jgi:hypothetical protein
VRTLVYGIVLSLAVVLTLRSVVDAAHGAPSARVYAEPRVLAGAPALAGYIYNDGPYRIRNVRLKVAGLDGNGVVIEEVMGGVEGDIAARSRGYFIVTMTRTASSHRVTVVSFDMVSRGE